MYAPSSEERSKWLEALELAKKSCAMSKVDMLMLDEFADADTDRSGKLSFGEIKRLLKDLGIQLPSKEIKKKFKRVDTDGNGCALLATCARSVCVCLCVCLTHARARSQKSQEPRFRRVL